MLMAMINITKHLFIEPGHQRLEGEIKKTLGFEATLVVDIELSKCIQCIYILYFTFTKLYCLDHRKCPKANFSLVHCKAARDGLLLGALLFT